MLIARRPLASLLRPLALGAVAASLCTLAPSRAGAHFILEEPGAWMSQDTLGSPQKLGPCGNEAGGTATGVVSTFVEGQKITITVNETIFHPGHYRIALAQDQASLPMEPVVTPGSNSPCGTAAVESPATYPILADGVLDHAAPFSGPQTITVTLPPGVTCDKCTLQVLEFMSEHPLNNPGGCFYHHCADIQITPAPDGGAASSSVASSSGMVGTGGTSAGNGGSPGIGGESAAGGSGSGNASGGCGCSTPGSGAPSLAGVSGLLLAAAVMSRRHRKARRGSPRA